MKRKSKQISNSAFDESLDVNMRLFSHYKTQIMQIAISRFEYHNMPPYVNKHYLETALIQNGMAIFFKDEIINEFTALRVTPAGRVNEFNEPKFRRAYGANGFIISKKELTDENSVIIYNNNLHTAIELDINLYAEKLALLDQITMINANAQKTPLFITVENESQMLTLKNLFMKYDGNAEVIFADKSLKPDSIRVLKTDAPYIADKITQLKKEVWQEVLTFLGVPSTQIQKKERLITDEVNLSLGGVLANRFSPLGARQEALEQINNMFGLNISVNYRGEYAEQTNPTKDGDQQ